MKRIVLVAAVLIGCESDSQTLNRLQVKRTLAELDVARWQAALLPPHRTGASVEERIRVDTATPPDSLLDSLVAAQIRLDLATRDLDRFLK